MAQRKYLNETGLSYFWEKIKNYLKYRNIIPEQSKTFTDVIGTANSWAGATFFYGSIKPTDWNVLWEIHFRIRTYIPGKAQYDMIADVRLSGTQGDLKSYASYNTVGTYYPAYYHELYRLKSAGLTNGYGHSLGVRLYSSYSPTDTNYKRTIVVDIFETKNCTFTFYDSCLAYSAIPGTGSTNYNTYSEINYVSNGLREAGDENDVNYQNRIYYVYRKPYTVLYRYQILLSRSDGTLLPINTVSNSTATNKTLTTESFDPFGEIYFYNSTSTIQTTGNISNAAIYRQILADLRFSFNTGTTLVSYKPVFLVAVPQSDGSAKLHTNPISQDYPTSEDGLLYILLGYPYAESPAYRLELYLTHPIYWYKNGAIRQYTGVSQANSHATGISIANHGTSSITGVSGSVTGSHVKSGGNGTAPTLGTAFTVPNVTAKGSGSFTSGAFSGGSGSFSATVTNHVMSFSHTHTAATHAADTHVHTAPTLGTAFTIPNVTSVGSASNWVFEDVTVPKAASAKTVVTEASHTITDNGHTHTLS